MKKNLKQKMLLKVAPINTKRRFFFKLMRNALQNPKIYLRAINLENIKKFRYLIKSENIQNLEQKLNNFHGKRIEIKDFTLDIFQEKNNFLKIKFEKYEEPKVSIIIPVHNQWEYTYNCLKSIKENTKDTEYEIIIADDVSTDLTKDINNFIENITVIRNENNLGFLKNCNNAVKYARGKYIHFLNNDTNVQKNWLSSLIELIESNEKIGMVGSKLVYPDGILQEAGGIIWEDASGWNYGRMDDPQKSEYNYVKEVDYISGVSIMIRKELWEEIGGFDERYTPAYCEDSDLAFEVRKKGYKVVYQPFSCVVHFEGKSHGKDEKKGIKQYQVINKEKFLLKWKKELKKQYKNAENVFLARDRSREKRTILVIDHYVPTFDKDAGSRTVFQYLKLLVKLGYNVKFIGDNYFRDTEYTPVLQKLGIEVLYGNWYSKNWKKWIKVNSKYIDICFLNRPHIAKKYIDFVKENTNAKIIYYGHDLHFLREKREYEILENKETLLFSQKTKKTELDIISKSDLSYYPSKIEIEELKKINKEFNVKILPPYMFKKKMIPQKIEFNKKENLLFIGSFIHKPNFDAVKWFLNKVFPKVIEKKPEIKLVIVGSNIPKEIYDRANKNIIIKGYITDEELKTLYEQCKFSIVPLRYGAGIKGKLIEALYNGIPVITTNVGIEGLDSIEDSVIIANTAEEFSEKILKYYEDNSYLQKLTHNGYNYINENFIEENAKDVIINDFNSLVPKGYIKIKFEKYEEPKVSIIIPVHNQWEYTYNCLKSIKENTKDTEYEIIIADDVSTDLTKDINNFIENITVIRNENNLGFLKNCNNAVKYARGKYIHFLNNDTNVQKNWLSSLIELIESNEKIGMVGSKLVYPDGILQEAGGIIWEDASGWNYGRMDDPQKSEYNYVKEVDYISGVSIMIRKELWEEIGGFDERYTPAYCEDSDLAFEVRKKGYKVVYQPFSCVVHFEGKSHGKDEKKGIKQYQVINKEKFLLKWKKELKKQYKNAENVFLARDRSREKRTILVIDHYVPTFDKDAGSRTVFQYLKLLVKLGYNVKFIGDNYFRDTEYTPVLQKLGIEVLYGNWYSKNWKKWIKVNSKYIDYIISNRPHITIKYIEILKKYTNAKLIYYGHDLHFLRERRQYEIEKDKKLLSSSKKWENIEKEIFEKFDVILTLSNEELKIIKNLSPNKTVKILPIFSFSNFKEKNFEYSKDVIFVGGFNHKPNLDAVRWFLKEVFPKVIEEKSEIRLIIVGSNPPKEILDLQSKNIIVKSNLTDVELENIYNESRIAIIPLRYGAGVKGKTVEAMYYGLPIVSTKVGIEGLEKIETLIKYNNNSIDFSKELLELYNKSDIELKEISKNYQNYVKNRFSEIAMKKLFSEILEETNE